METDPETVRREYPRTNPKHWINVTAEDIPPGWIDDMVKRLFEELNRQIIRVERVSEQKSDKKDAQGNYEDDPIEREQSARVLASLQRSLERLTVMEAGRAPQRKSRKSEKPGETRARLIQRLADQRERARTGNISGEPK
jgi:hypothetical protein